MSDDAVGHVGASAWRDPATGLVSLAVARRRDDEDDGLVVETTTDVDCSTRRLRYYGGVAMDAVDELGPAPVLISLSDDELQAIVTALSGVDD